MNTDQREAILKRHEKLLWWMTDQARFAFIAELREDYLYEDLLSSVSEAVSCVPEDTSPQAISA